MTYKKMLAGLAAVSMMIAIPGMANAQQHRHADSTWHGGMMHGSMGNMHMGAMNGSEMMMNMMGMSTSIMRLQPDQVLSESDELGLTEAQVYRIREIANAQRDAYRAHMNSMPGHSEELNKMLGDESVSSAEIREWVEGGNEDYRDMHMRMIEDALDVREVLSQQQLESALALALDPSAMMMQGGGQMHRQGGHAPR